MGGCSCRRANVDYALGALDILGLVRRDRNASAVTHNVVETARPRWLDPMTDPLHPAST